jgi:hypothetical protein
MKKPTTLSPALKQLERRSIAAREAFDTLRAATTQAQNAMVAMHGVSQTATDPTLKAALEGYAQFSESMLRTLEGKLTELKAEVNRCASDYAQQVYGIQLGDRIMAKNVCSTLHSTVIDITEMGIDGALSADGIHRQVYAAGTKVGTRGNALKSSAWLMLGNPAVPVSKAP